MKKKCMIKFDTPYKASYGSPGGGGGSGGGGVNSVRPGGGGTFGGGGGGSFGGGGNGRQAGNPDGPNAFNSGLRPGESLMPYRYGYAIQDDEGNDFNAQEQSDGDQVKAIEILENLYFCFPDHWTVLSPPP